MTVVPAQLDRVIADSADFFELRVRHFDKASLGAMALAKRARTIPAQVRLSILTYVTIVPCDAHDAARFDMVDLRRNGHKRKIANSASEPILPHPAIMNSTAVRLTGTAADTKLTLLRCSQNSIKPSPIAVMNPILARLTK
jgi:hypothetical protein